MIEDLITLFFFISAIDYSLFLLLDRDHDETSASLYHCDTRDIDLDHLRRQGRGKF